MITSENCKELKTVKWPISVGKKYYKYYFGYAYDIRKNLGTSENDIL